MVAWDSHQYRSEVTHLSTLPTSEIGNAAATNNGGSASSKPVSGKALRRPCVLHPLQSNWQQADFTAYVIVKSAAFAAEGSGCVCAMPFIAFQVCRSTCDQFLDNLLSDNAGKWTALSAQHTWQISELFESTLLGEDDEEASIPG